MIRIKNGGIESGILRAIADHDGIESLPEKDRKRLEYLEGLPKDKWIALDENGMAITDEEAEERLREQLSNFSTPDGNPII